jgi:metallo-beta-lactamase class B
MKVRLHAFALAVVATAVSLSFAPNAAGQRVDRPISEWPKPAEFPKEDKAAATEHFRKAREYAVGDLFADFTLRCITDPKYRQRVNAEQYDGIVTPAKVFDNFYYVGQMAVGAWALKTSEGIVLFDALNNEAEAREIIVPGLTAVGLDPKDVKWIILTHSHGDHYGGAPYFQKLGAKVISSDIDWKVMKPRRGGNAAPATRDITIADDGQTMTFGDTEVTFYIPKQRHTLSMIFPSPIEAEHIVASTAASACRAQWRPNGRKSPAIKWRSVTKTSGRPNRQPSFERRYSAWSSALPPAWDPNPYVLGVDVSKLFGVQEMRRFSLARDGLRE